MKLGRYIFANIFTFTVLTVSAAAPSGYYDSCKGKSGATLLSQLKTVISNHTTISYKGLWDLYLTSDVDANGKIWDMYSTKRWNPGEKCGSYSSVGDCYNREHSFPKSWFDDASPMVSDGFHIYPTDGKVNGQRSNYPFGECANGTTLSASGGIRALGRLGKSTYPGYSGTVFEPDDQYKGDFARSYFYMAACYNDRISSWHSDMLAGNKYPVFKSWAIEMLLKWSREDPVSQKEIDRNEAVYNKQRNRNPFIDHPELAEHIWGNKSTSGWQQGGTTTADPVFTQPVNNSSLDLGRGAVNKNISKALTVRGKDFTSTVTVSVSGAGFSVSPTSLTASAVNSGTTLTVTLNQPQAGTYTGTLTLTSGAAKTVVSLRGETVSGIPANAATDVTTSSFRANWVNVGDASTKYTLHVTQNSSELPGYPIEVQASAGSHTVSGLESGATYVYWLTSMGLESNHISVTTHNELPELNVSIEEDLNFRTTPGTPSAPKTIVVDAFNIDDDIIASVRPPFEVSTDRANWSRKITMAADDDHFYIRLNGSEPGIYYTSVDISAGDFVNDNLTAQGTIADASSSTFLESFEAAVSAGYQAEDLQFDAASWDMSSAGAFDGDTRIAHTGSNGVRFNRDEGGYVAMSSSKAAGLGTVSFWTCMFDKDSSACLVAEYSTDGGTTWTEFATVTPTADWKQTKADINVKGDNCRLRFTKVSGARVALDDIEATNYGGTAIETVESDALTWEAYNRDGLLVIENFGDNAIDTSVYTTDAAERFSATVGSGLSVTVPLAPGVYIIVAGDASRRVVIR